jgi:hypothetical protein
MNSKISPTLQGIKPGRYSIIPLKQEQHILLERKGQASKGKITSNKGGKSHICAKYRQSYIVG